MSDLPKIHLVILAGGDGKRLWPLSRKSYPKQFASNLGEKSLFQQTVERFSDPQFHAPVIVTGDHSRFIVVEQIQALGTEPDTILIEPDGRDTAPALLAACQWIARKEPDALILVTASDHAIKDARCLKNAIQKAVSSAQSGHLVAFGVKPTRPETGLYYLELDRHADLTARAPQKTVKLTMKPRESEAWKMMQSGRYLWNTGIFLFTAKSVLEAFKMHEPDIFQSAFTSVEKAKYDLGFFRLEPQSWLDQKSTSFEEAVLCKADNMATMPYNGDWADMSSWEMVWHASCPDKDGVVTAGQATAINCSNSLLRSEDEKLALVGIGLENIVAVATRDAVVVANKAQSTRIQDAVKILSDAGVHQAEAFQIDHRPWGWYESLALGERFHVKRLIVTPGASLSLQSHHHRSEHWIVVEGTAKVKIGETEQLVTENQSVYIPLGAMHRLENPGKVPVVLIEVQTGTYLEEDDITRFEDLYKRQSKDHG